MGDLERAVEWVRSPVAGYKKGPGALAGEHGRIRRRWRGRQLGSTCPDAGLGTNGGGRRGPGVAAAEARVSRRLQEWPVLERAGTALRFSPSQSQEIIHTPPKAFWRAQGVFLAVCCAENRRIA